jgi:hypothetical protein
MWYYYEDGIGFEFGVIVIEENGLYISITHVAVLLYIFLALRYLAG